MLRRKTVLAAVGAAVLVGAAAATAAIAPIKEYTVPLTPEYTIKKIISVGDTVPETSDPTKQYQMVGIPDGLGAHGEPGRDDHGLHESRADRQRRSPSRSSAIRSTGARSSRS